MLVRTVCYVLLCVALSYACTPPPPGSLHERRYGWLHEQAVICSTFSNPGFGAQTTLALDTIYYAEFEEYLKNSYFEHKLVYTASIIGYSAPSEVNSGLETVTVVVDKVYKSPQPISRDTLYYAQYVGMGSCRRASPELLGKRFLAISDSVPIDAFDRSGAPVDLYSHFRGTLVDGNSVTNPSFALFEVSVERMEQLFELTTAVKDGNRDTSVHRKYARGGAMDGASWYSLTGRRLSVQEMNRHPGLVISAQGGIQRQLLMRNKAE